MTSLIPHTIKPPLGYRIDPFHPLARGLIACYLMNEAGGNTLYDIVNNFNGTFQNDPAWVAGQDGPAIEFDGGNDFINIGNHGSTLEPAHISIVAWVRSAGVGTNDYLVSYERTADNDTSYGLYTGSDGTIYCLIYHNNPTFSLSPSGGNIWDGSWHQVVGTYDEIKLRIYIDESEVGAGTAEVNSIDYANERKLVFGAFSDTPILAFPGDISSISIFNRALSAVEVAQLYREPYAFIRPILPIEWMSFVAAVGGNISLLAGMGNNMGSSANLMTG